MFEFRQRGDYEDFVEFEKEMVQEWLVTAQEFVAVIIKTIDSMKNS